MKWIKSSNKMPRLNKEVVGFIYCSCGVVNDKNVHRINCYNKSYDIFSICCDAQTKELYWSPCAPDFWMELPDEPEEE